MPHTTETTHFYPYRDADGTMASGTTEVMTVPATCPSSIDYGSDNRLTFGDPCKCDDPRNCQAGNTYFFHDTLRIPATGTTTAGLDIRVNASTGFFIDVHCFGGTLTEPTTGASGTRIMETATGSGVYKIEFRRLFGAAKDVCLGVFQNYPTQLTRLDCTRIKRIKRFPY